MKLLRTILLMFTLLPLAACALSGGPLEGQVLEVGTKKPIPGAIVIARWHGTYSAIAESKSVCYHVETATTDGEGRYKISSWQEKSKGLFFGADEGQDITAYKTGYTEYWPVRYSGTDEYKKNIRSLEPFKGTREERLKELERMLGATRCGSQNESERNLYTFYNAMYEEAKNIAVTKEDLEIVDTLKYWTSFVILDKNKPMSRDAKGRIINVDQKEK